MVSRKKEHLSPDEVDKIVKKIKERYRDFMIEYMRPDTVRLIDLFEERYIQALKARIDLTDFVYAEVMTIDELFRQEKQKEGKVVPREKKQETGPDLADRVLEEFRKRIEPYPDAPLPPSVPFEIRKLFGALMEFERQYWHRIQNMVRKYFPAYYASMRAALETRIFHFCTSNMEGFPPRISRYCAMFTRFPRNYKLIDKEEKACLAETSSLLQEVLSELTALDNVPQMEPEEKEVIAGSRTNINNILYDFRLKDLSQLL